MIYRLLEMGTRCPGSYSHVLQIDGITSENAKLVCGDLQALDKINLCISDNRTWVIKNKLKIDDSKTEFLVLTSSFSKRQFNDVQINVCNAEMTPSLSACNLGVA